MRRGGLQRDADRSTDAARAAVETCAAQAPARVRQAREIVRNALAQARQRGRTAIAEERSRTASELGAAEARLATERQLAAQRHAMRLLALAWDRLRAALARLYAEYRKTVRRVRALQDALLPETESALAQIETSLEELEQDAFGFLRRAMRAAQS